MEQSQLFPPVEPLFILGRKFLCEKLEDAKTLAEFEAELPRLRRAPEVIRDLVRAHAEYMHNAGRIDEAGAAKLRALLEPYAQGHFQRMCAMLLARFSNPDLSGEAATRQKKLRDAVLLETAKGET